MASQDTIGVFSSFRERNVKIFFAGLGFSNIGTWAQITTVVFVVRRLGGAGVELGLVTALQFIPLLLLGLWAGAYADRHDRYRITMIIQVAMGVQAVVLGILDLTGRLSIPVIYVLTLVLGTLHAFENPTRRGMITELVDADHLANITSLSTSVMTGARMFGPAAAAVLVAWVGTGWVFIANGLTFLVLFAAMTTMDPTSFHRIARAPKSATPIRDALRAVFDDPSLRVAVVVYAVISTFAFNNLVGLPLLVTDVLGEDESVFGWVLSILSVGNVLGALVVARLVSVRQRFFYLTAAGVALFLAVTAAAPTTMWLFAASFLFGIVSASFVSSSNVMLQQRSDPELRSRVLALGSVLFLGSTPVGGPVTGVVADVFGARWANLYGAIIAAAAVGLGLVYERRLRRRTS